MSPQVDPFSSSPTMGVEDWRAGYAIKNPGLLEVIGAMLYDYQTYVSGTTTILTFFNTLPADKFSGNMQLAGQLPAGNSFLIGSIRVAPIPDASELATAVGADGQANGALQDINLLMRDCIATLFIGQKDYGSWPAMALPGGMGAYGEFGNIGTTVAGSNQQFQSGVNGAPDPRSVYSLAQPLALPEQYNFRLTLEWTAAVTLFGGNTTIIGMFDGELMRPSQ